MTPCLSSTFGEEDEAEPTDRPKVVILGSGPNRIGQGIEFDYCCVHAAFALSKLGYETAKQWPTPAGQRVARRRRGDPPDRLEVRRACVTTLSGAMAARRDRGQGSSSDSGVTDVYPRRTISRLWTKARGYFSASGA
jgi:hypothetical protein